MTDAPWPISPRKLGTACAIGVVVVTIAVWLVTTWNLPAGEKSFVGFMDLVALGVGVPFVYVGASRLANPDLPIHTSERVGSSTRRFSRRGAFAFICFGLYFCASILLVGASVAARSLERSHRPPPVVTTPEQE